MKQENAYAALMAHMCETVALGQVSGLLGWDQETMMPKGGGAQRAEQLSALEAVLHAKRTDPRIGEWLDQVGSPGSDDVAAGNIRQIKRSFERQSRIPADLAVEIARVTSVAQGIWAEARAAGKFADFQDILTEVLNLRRQEAQAITTDGPLYDALLDDYEPGMTSEELDHLLGGLRTGLVDLRAKVAESAVEIPDLQGKFSKTQQMLIAKELACAFGYDWSRGRLDFSVHPFSSGSHNDVRITTRIAEDDPFNCFYSTIHEVGHAVYEQNVLQAYGGTPIGHGASMGVHESQSRISENQLGRSRAFTGYLFGRMTEVFGDIGVGSQGEFYCIVNKMRRGFIRTEADEVQYNLHVLLRYDLERAMISGDLEIRDLEAAWNDRFERDFGYRVDQPANGVLQDVHWSVGLFGYFPTYALGNIYAGELFEGLSRDVPALQDDLARGDTTAAISWLKHKIHRFGSLHDPRSTMRNAVGRTPSEKPLLAYLEAKFSDIYQI